MRSTDPRSTKRPSTTIGSGRLRGSRPSSFRPKLNSKYAGCQSSSSASFCTQMPRSRRRSSISSRQTRSIAGASVFGVLGGDAVEHLVERRATASGSVARVTGSACPASSDGRTRPARGGTGCRASADPCGRAAPARPTARAGGSSRAGTGTDSVANRCSADSEYGRCGQPVRLRARVATPSVRRRSGRRSTTTPARPRAQRLMTDRRSASFRPSR